MSENAQKFTATTTREALNQVRKSLGADAIILRQTDTPEGVTIEACTELPAPAPQQPAAEAPDGRNPTQAVTDLFTVLPEQGEPDEPDSAAQSQERELPHPASHAMTLTALGYSSSVLEDFAFCRDAQTLRRQLLDRLQFSTDAVSRLSGVYRFTGASGSGKTSLLIKMLLEWTLHNDPADAVVVSTDQTKLGAGESLQLATQMLSVEIVECPAVELAARLPGLAGKKLVLIDTPSADAPRAGRPLREPDNTPGNIKDVWVVSAQHNLANIEAERAAQRNIPDQIAITHVDQLMCADAWLNHIYRLRLPLLCISSSGEISGAMETADADVVERHFFGQCRASVNNLTIEA